MRWFKRKEKGNGYMVENVGISQSGDDARVGGRVGSGKAPGACGGGPGNDGVRDPRGSARGDRHTRHHCVPRAPQRIVGRDHRGHQRLVEAIAGQSGQATVEFAVIAAGFLVITVALMALWRMLNDGLVVEHALAVASHHIQAVAPAAVVDIFLY